MNNYSKWLIVNYHSGSTGPAFKAVLSNLLEPYKDIEVKETEYAGHAIQIAQQAVAEGIKMVVVVGGDGTINEVAGVLAGTETKMVVVAKGSGNGLARHLGLSMQVAVALQKIIDGKTIEIDMASINHIKFFCTAGIGFDAAVAHNFAQRKGRGLLNYIKASIYVYFNFKTLDITLRYKGKQFEKKLFTLTFANAGQYGNNAWIAPEAVIDDGLLDVVLLQPYPWWATPFIVFRLFNKSLHKSSYVETFRAAEIEIHAKDNFLIHYDGEPRQLESKHLVVKIEQKKLKILT